MLDLFVANIFSEFIYRLERLPKLRSERAKSHELVGSIAPLLRGSLDDLEPRQLLEVQRDRLCALPEDGLELGHADSLPREEVVEQNFFRLVAELRHLLLGDPARDALLGGRLEEKVRQRAGLLLCLL